MKDTVFSVRNFDNNQLSDSLIAIFCLPAECRCTKHCRIALFKL